jgi:hypothetical protein
MALAVRSQESEGFTVLLSLHGASPATRSESLGLGRTFTDWLIWKLSRQLAIASPAKSFLKARFDGAITVATSFAGLDSAFR